MNEDAELLSQYATSRDQGAFAQLVARHVDLVYSVALRTANGDSHAARDISQVVFTALAHEAGPLSRRPVLTGWLYRTTQFTAAKYVRTESRRRAREQKAHLMNQADSDSDGTIDWNKVRPLVDTSMAELTERDRDALMFRYFENRSFAEVGSRFRLSEDAARMRVDRALDRVRESLSRRGIRSTNAVLALGLAAEISTAAPAGLAATLATSAGAVGGTAPGVVATILLMSSLSAKIGALVMVAATAAGGLYLYRSASGGAAAGKLRENEVILSAESSPKRAAIASPPAEPAKPLTVQGILEQLRAADALSDSPEKSARILALHKAWAEIDATGALNSAAARGGELAFAILEDVTTRDARVAWDWVAALPSGLRPVDGFYPAEAYRRVVATMVRNGAGSTAARFVASMPSASGSPFTSEAARELAATWAVNSPKEVALWMQGVTDQQSLGSAAQAFGKVLAAGLLSEMVPLLEMQNERVGNLMLAGATREWVRLGEAEKIAEYSRSNPQMPDSRHDMIFGALSQTVGKENPEAQLAMILEMRTPSERDRYLWNASAESPEGEPQHPTRAMTFVLPISDPARRQDRALAIYRQWMKTDPVAARAFVTSASFPPDLGRTILAAAESLASDPRELSIAAELAAARENARSAATQVNQIALTEKELTLQAESRRLASEAVRKAQEQTEQLNQAAPK